MNSCALCTGRRASIERAEVSRASASRRACRSSQRPRDRCSSLWACRPTRCRGSTTSTESRLSCLNSSATTTRAYVNYLYISCQNILWSVESSCFKTCLSQLKALSSLSEFEFCCFILKTSNTIATMVYCTKLIGH